MFKLILRIRQKLQINNKNGYQCMFEKCYATSIKKSSNKGKRFV